MSYLDGTRLHFAGRFQADTSTINNDVRHFDDAKFRPSFQEIMQTKGDTIVKYNGYWNPDGTGAWRMVGCAITGAVLNGRACGTGDDPVLSMQLTGADDRVAGKLVDLDPQQQMVSEIWGLGIRLQDAKGRTAVRSEFEVAPFCDLWLRQQNATHAFDQTLAAAYQSHLIDVEWHDISDSPVLCALQQASADGQLSIRMNVFGYDRTPGAPDYTTGRVVGTIGPASATGPKRFVLGRQLVATLDKASYPFVPNNKISNIQAQVDNGACRVTADFGNALPTTDSSGDLENLGEMHFGVLKDADTAQGDTINASEVALIGALPYRQKHWYPRTAGVVDFDFGGNSWVVDNIGDHPLAILQENSSGFTVMNRETLDGVFVRADQFVFRLNAGQDAGADLWATRYGAPLAATVETSSTEGFMGGDGTGAKLPDIKTPPIGTPDGIVTYAASLQTDRHGHGALTLSAATDGPNQGKPLGPRGYLDGQLYGVAYQLHNQPKGYASNPFNYLSILAWNRFEAPAQPTWYQDIQPILQQYANLYPIMSKSLFDLADYDQVVQNLAILELSFRLPISNPNSMPVTRDLSDAKRQMILRWLTTPDPATGKPYLGDPPPAQPEGVTSAAAEASADAPDVASKFNFVRQALAHQNRSGQ